MNLAAAGAVIFAAIAPGIRVGTVYSEQMHAVVNTGDSLQIHSAENGWDLLISGYQLTLP